MTGWSKHISMDLLPPILITQISVLGTTTTNFKSSHDNSRQTHKLHENKRSDLIKQLWVKCVLSSKCIKSKTFQMLMKTTNYYLNVWHNKIYQNPSLSLKPLRCLGVHQASTTKSEWTWLILRLDMNINTVTRERFLGRNLEACYKENQ